MRPPRISAYEPQVLERQQHSLADMLAIPAPDACTRWLRGDRGNADSVSSIMRLLVALLGVLLSLLRPMEGHHGYASTALGWSICATGASAASHVEAPARLVAQHQNPAKKRTVLALLSHGYIRCSPPLLLQQLRRGMLDVGTATPLPGG